MIATSITLDIRWGGLIKPTQDYAQALAARENTKVKFKFNTITWVYHPDGSLDRYNEKGKI